MLVTVTLNRMRNTQLQSSDGLLFHLSPLQITLHWMKCRGQVVGNFDLQRLGKEETLISIFFMLCIVHFTGNYVDILLSVIPYYGGRNCRKFAGTNIQLSIMGRCPPWAGVRNERFAH